MPEIHNSSIEIRPAHQMLQLINEISALTLLPLWNLVDSL